MKVLVVVLAAVLTYSGHSWAALPAAVTDSLSVAKSDGVLIAGTILGVIVSIVGIRYIWIAVAIHNFEREHELDSLFDYEAEEMWLEDHKEDT